jgi:aspartyl-tRNA(Asn)/glutamyl-tRNA(Gln) amidotransferase subunit B
MSYEPVIGLEIHTQLKTASKLFCGCSTKFGAEPNAQVCEVCLGMPGVLPVINAKAVELAVTMGLATNCRINAKSVFARKNYFYPDLPKGYQISQYDRPLCEGGHMDIEVNGAKKRIGITRIHMEEDAGKLLHDGTGEASSLVDLNRTGVPLIEIVSEPDIRSADEAVAYMKAIHSIVLYTAVSDGNMEEGSFRCDANVSVRPIGEKKFGTRTEMKNLNSFKFVKDAIAYEIARQIELIEDGGRVMQETRLWDSAKGKSFAMRSKEEAHDYRYFPEPDLLPLVVSDKTVSAVRSRLPELPAQKRERFERDYALPAYDAGVLTAERAVADYFEEAAKASKDAKAASNWVMGECLRLLNEEGRAIADCLVTPRMLASLLALIKDGAISTKMAKTVFEEMYKTGKEAGAIVKEQGLSQISDSSTLSSVIDSIIAANPKEVERFKAGEEKLMAFFVGQAMKATKGQANPGVLDGLIKEKLK